MSEENNALILPAVKVAVQAEHAGKHELRFHCSP